MHDALGVAASRMLRKASGVYALMFFAKSLLATSERDMHRYRSLRVAGSSLQKRAQAEAQCH